MSGHSRFFRVAWYSVFLLGFSNCISAWEKLGSDLDIHCIQAQAAYLDCSYRPLFPGKVSSITAKAGKLELPVKPDFSNSDDTTAIFFLVDTSDPARQEVVRKNIEQVKRLLVTSKARHRLGLASFDKKLRIHAPVGSGKSQIIAASSSIRAEGKTTELYRNLLLTIEKLSRTKATRKAIFLFSDGQAEDKAYFHADVIRAARKKAIIINTIGFPRSVSLSVALQTLRRISEETGGVYVEADRNFELPDEFYRRPFDSIDAGGQFRVDMTELAAVNRLNTPQLNIEFNTDVGKVNMMIPVSLPVTRLNATSSTPSTGQPMSPVQPEIRIVSPVVQPEKFNAWLWYGLPAAVVVLFIILLIALILIYRRQPDKNVFSSSIQPQNKPFAYLVTQDGESTRYPITSTTWRIGRSRDNELTLDDNSVSRLHAEIHRYNNGNFFILDMQSLNGIYVNDEQVSNKKLQEGDIIEVGDIYLRFTQLPEDYQLEDDTAIQKTKTPVH